MQRKFIVVCGFALASGLMSSGVSAETAFSVSAHVGNFHVAVANYYQVPEREVIVIRERRIPDDEIPVVLFIAREARVSPARVIALRRAGGSWWDISVRFGLRPDVYYVPVRIAPGPPYGKAYGHYKKPRNQWNTIVLSDADVTNMVHLRFLSEHYRIPPERVMESRARHRDIVAMHAEIGGRKGGGGRGESSGAHGRGSAVVRAHAPASADNQGRGRAGAGKGAASGKDNRDGKGKGR